MSRRRSVLVIGGTGAQGLPVVKSLAEGESYSVVVMTRNPSTDHSQEISRIPNVTLFPVKTDTFSEAELNAAFSDVELAFVNTNGFGIGEKEEVYWGTRMYEIARTQHLKHFVWASVPHASKLGNYDPKYRSGFMDAKGKVTDFILAQDLKAMAWSILTSCPYMDTLSSNMWRPEYDDSTDTYTFVGGMGNGAAPMIDLADLGRYARWQFDNPNESNGMNLKVATEHCSLAHMAAMFTKVTGKKATSMPLPLSQFFDLLEARGIKMDVQLGPVGTKDRYTNRSWLTGFHNLWSASGENKGLARVDYALLDRILPDRKKSLEEFMRKTEYNGEFKRVLRMRMSRDPITGGVEQ